MLQNNNYAILIFKVIYAQTIKRHLEDKIRSALATSSSVALMRPRQVGKTTLAINIADTIPFVYLDLKNRIDLQKTQDNKQPRGKTTAY